ncbi:ExbD/TolR family protein [Phaeocystidibacter marisrubri]|uniref:Biopolymer transporter ExbD n=1 Tax=Phaeocystidibacter marisrubri TaxID=1577780 RepID=A0A6L3ZDC7_9FLAO|nr:biopolymer transporter ExbD [Phaeocystidibacter marisrubri]KAB2815223.1 biopolymer transporter ExbD [Phaeocystidibacter marisrubri]GGH70963.1 biopolymer transporter ExbD [Phaeocystidibacter marisrubri]
MARKKREIAEINAGSMADIAFLLLIFFLVTTTMDIDKGLNRLLPPIEEDKPEIQDQIKEKNIFVVVINANNQLLVENEYMEISELRESAMEFIDNNGDGSCMECGGDQSPTSSDNPKKAIISISSDRGTSYDMYVSVTNELMAAYHELRDDLCMRKWGKDYDTIKEEAKDAEDDSEAKDRYKYVQEVYPLLLSEAEPKSVG